jgi:nucleoid DNA-binding protein
MARKSDIDREVILETGLSERTVKLVTQVFLSKVTEALVAGQAVTLDNFGRLHLAEQGGAPPPHARFGTGEKNTEETSVRFRVHFTKAPAFSETLRQHNLEKSHGKVRRKRIS